MNIFDVEFETVYSEDKEPKKLSFNLTFDAVKYPFQLGHYVIYPSLTHRELILITKSRFNDYKARFEELAKLINLSRNEEKSGVKDKHRKHTVSDNDWAEFKKLRHIMSYSLEFAICARQTTVSIPYRFAEILHLKEDFLTFVQTDKCEFLLINPADAWMYMPRQAYGYQADDEEESFFSKLKRAI